VYRKDVDRLQDGDKTLLRNKPTKKKLLNYFLAAECWAHSPSHKLELWMLPINIPSDRIETVERIRQSLTKFPTVMNWLTTQERVQAWAKLSKAAKRHGITVPTQMPAPKKIDNKSWVSATHRMAIEL
jgi:hypothetical protein